MGGSTRINSDKRYKSRYTIGYEKNASRQAKKANKYKQKANKAAKKSMEYKKYASASKDIDKQTKNFYKSQSNGAKIAQSLLSNYGKEAYAYNRTVLGKTKPKSVTNVLTKFGQAKYEFDRHLTVVQNANRKKK